MKHIKHYESIKDDTIKDDTIEDVHPQLAKYLICKSEEDNIICLSIINVEEFNENYVNVKTMSFDRNNIPHYSINIKVTISSILNRLVYKSNNIEDIINILPIIKTQNKFNL